MLSRASRLSYLDRLALRLLVGAFLCASARGALTLPDNAPACVHWAAGKVTAALAEKRISIDTVTIAVTPGEGVPPEGFSLTSQAHEIMIAGADAHGQMYGLLELAEQIGNTERLNTWELVSDAIVSTRQAPYLAFRADNSFLHDRVGSLKAALERYKLANPPLLFEPLSMWKSYIDMLASNRFNTLDLHGGYNLSTTKFFNLLPLLVSVPGYKNLSNAEVQRHNQANLAELIRYGEDRGVALGLMNYATKVEEVSQKSLADYTRKAVVKLLKEVPELKRFGFRIGESGEDTDFFKNTYIAGVQESGRKDLRVYTRSWKTDLSDMNELAEISGGKLDLEVKFNGEHLGLPYQAIHGPLHRQYSYEDCLDPSAKYRTIWQVRAAGTHRLWTWAQTDFIRRTIQACRFGDATGFSLEPPTAYADAEAASSFQSSADAQVFHYTWERHWPWYLTWGRVAYNPDLPASTLIAAYQRHFGKAGASIYEAMQASGTAVPLAMAYHYAGPDQRNFSPETQTGAFDPAKDEPVTPLSFALATPMDSRSFASIDEFVTEKIDGKVDGRVGPVQVAEVLRSASRTTREAVQQAEGRGVSNPKEWRLLKADILGAAMLGNYYAMRIQGITYLDYALKTSSKKDYQKAVRKLDESRNEWAQLAAAEDSLYAPVDDPLLEQKGYTWGSQNVPLVRLDGMASELWRRVIGKGNGVTAANGPMEPTVEFGVRMTESSYRAEPGNLALIEAKLEPADAVAEVSVWTKAIPSEAKWVRTPMVRDGKGLVSAVVPLTREGLLYLIEVRNQAGAAKQFPDVFAETPYRVIPASTKADAAKVVHNGNGGAGALGIR